MWNIFFSKFCCLLFVFYYFWHFIFNFVYLYLSTYSTNFYIFILWIRDFIIKFWKIMEYFSKKYRHLKSKIPHNVHRLLFVFFFSILIIFFSYFTCPNLSKNSKHFCGALLYGLQILSENFGNSWISTKKRRDTLNTKHFKNSIVYYLLFLIF